MALESIFEVFIEMLIVIKSKTNDNMIKLNV